MVIQALANYSPQAKSSPSPVFVTNVLLEHSHAHLFLYYDFFSAITAELSS